MQAVERGTGAGTYWLKSADDLTVYRTQLEVETWTFRLNLTVRFLPGIVALEQRNKQSVSRKPARNLSGSDQEGSTAWNSGETAVRGGEY